MARGREAYDDKPGRRCDWMEAVNILVRVDRCDGREASICGGNMVRQNTVDRGIDIPASSPARPAHLADVVRQMVIDEHARFDGNFRLIATTWANAGGCRRQGRTDPGVRPRSATGGAFRFYGGARSAAIALPSIIRATTALGRTFRQDIGDYVANEHVDQQGSAGYVDAAQIEQITWSAWRRFGMRRKSPIIMKPQASGVRR